MSFPAYSANFLVTNTRNILKRGGICLQFSKKVHFKRVIPLAKNISLTQMEVKVENDGTKAVVTIPGFNLHDFDRTGYVNPAILSNVMDIQDHALIVSEDKFFECKLFECLTDEDIGIFLISLSATFFSHDISSITDEKDVQWIHELIDVGNSSYRVTVQMQLKQSEIVLVEWECLSVCVDRITRQPTPLPEQIKREVEKHVMGKTSMKRTLQSSDFELKEKRLPLFIVEKKVIDSDIDVNNHANYLFHYGMIMETMAEYMEYQHKNRNIQKRVGNLNMWYRDECLLGDVVEAWLWEDSLTSNVFIHLVNKTKENKVLVLCRIGLLPVQKSKI